MRFLDGLQGGESVYRLSHFPLGNPQLIKALQVKPKFGRRAEEMSESEGCITSDGSPAVQNFSDPIGWDIKPSCELGSAHA
jgi:hypothetical protein